MNIRGDATPLTPSSAHFKIPDVPHREKIGQELANRILTKPKKEKALQRVGGSREGGAHQSSFERLNSMSPAAQLLATKKLGLHSSMDRSLQASYSPMMTSSFRSPTPTPKQIRTPSPWLKLTPSAKHTSSLTSSTDKKSTYQPNSNAAKRTKASEFF